MSAAIAIYLMAHKGNFKSKIFNCESDLNCLDENTSPDNVRQFLLNIITFYPANNHLIVAAAVLLIEKLLRKSNIVFDHISWKRIVTSAIIVAAKTVSDDIATNIQISAAFRGPTTDSKSDSKIL